MKKEPNQFLRVAGVARDSIVDGPGVRLTVFVPGCKIKCPRCHNPGTWDFNGGYVISLSDVLSMYRPQYQGLTLSGGEPFDQDEEQTAALLSLASSIHARGGDVWAYSGHFLEFLQAKNHPLLGVIDALVDGPFAWSHKDLSLKYRNSSNKRIWINSPGGEWKNVTDKF
ncbi:MAG: radical SAM protein [Oscillospiraceae bacterium]|nr:radical SAM protein [Oscillospiraceae bacterium]